MVLNYKLETIPPGGPESVYSEVLEFLREYFFPQEPCAKAIDLCPHGYVMPALEVRLKQSFSQGLSLIARSTQGGDILGVVVVEEITRDGAKDEDATPGEEGFRCRGLPSKMLQLFRFFGEVSTDGGRTTAFDAMGADAAWDIFIVSVSDKAKNQGLAKAMFSEVLARAKAAGDCKLVQCLALSAYSIRICQKFGFQELFSLRYADYSQDGVKIFAGADMGQHTKGVLFAMKTA